LKRNDGSGESPFTVTTKKESAEVPTVELFKPQLQPNVSADLAHEE
jgi:hypothetical protein